MAHRWAKSPRIPNSRRPVTLQTYTLHSPCPIPAQASLWTNVISTVPASFRSIHLSSDTSLRVRYRAPTSAPTGVTIHTDRNFSSSRTQTRLLSSCSDNPYEGDEDRVRVGVRQGKGSGRGKSSGGRGGGLSGGKGRGEGGFASRGLATFAEVPQIYSPTPDQSPIVDARIAQADNLIQKLKSKRSGPERPVRPGYGSAGRAVVVRANFFPVNLSKDKFYEYNVEISPEPKSQKSRVKRRVLDLFQKSNEVSQYSSAIVHDGSQRLIAARKLPQSLSGSVGFYEKGDKGPPPNAEMYTVTVKFVKELAMGPLKRYIEGVGDVSKSEKQIAPLISALNLVIQHHVSQTGFRVGPNRHFFDDEEKGWLGSRLWAHLGFSSSARPVHKQVMVNVNVRMSAFHQPGNLADAVDAFIADPHGRRPREFMYRAKISTLHLGYRRTWVIRSIIGNHTASAERFKCDEYGGGTISVEEYYLRKYNLKLNRPDLPLVNVGGPDKAIYLPAELCTIEPGEPHFGRLSLQETSRMLHLASRRPAVNAHHIVQQGLPKLGLVPSTKVLDEFGVTVSSRMTVVPARELPAPKVAYKKNVAAVIKNGSWNMLQAKFSHGAQVTNWKVLVVVDGHPIVRDAKDPGIKLLVDNFVKKCTSSGMSMLQPSETLFVHLPSRKGRSGQSNAINALEQSMDQFAKDGSWEKVDFILVLLQVQDDFIYPCIKRLAAVKFGVHTQCLQLDRALEKKARDRYLSNVVLKVNMKLGGVNHHLHPSSMVWLSQKSTMMVGMDVTHPSPGCAPGTPSIAGVVASTGLDFVQFPASLRLQKSRQEGIEGLAGMVIERLEAYKEHNDSLPERILVFRDGVSEGQYDKVLREELPQIFEAFKRVDPGNAAYRPALSVVICGKRHNVRIYPTSEGDADENGNTRPGTVVDQGITSVRDFDFYLQAHAATQGTVRSTHYIVLYDENNLRADDIQQGVHSASYLWARATKAVSLVPAAYYAHVLCEKARYWIQGLSYNTYEGLETGVDDKKVGSPRAGIAKEAKEASVYLAAQKMWAGGLHENLKDSMFYL